VRGVLVTLEGIDGSGKTTAFQKIAQELNKTFPERHFVFTAEPTPGPAGKILRKVHLTERQSPNAKEISDVRIMEEMLLFMADHANHLAELVIPSLRKGGVVISDRYSDSTAAYQGVTLRGVVPDPVKWIRELLRPWNVVPDLTLLFLLDSHIAAKRIMSRSLADSSIEKFEKEAFLREVDGNFKLLAKLEPGRFVVIDASREADAVAYDVFKAISALLS
jgi:dTMP kinase